MIALIDDDLLTLSQVKDVLTGAGHEVAAYADPAVALEGIAANEPSLVISDVLMPELSGLELRARYGERFPERHTPFVFLSSLCETDDVVRGLEAGGDDYLPKPVVPELLIAKVRAHLRRARRAPLQAFHGELEKVPLTRVVEFCELQRLTGELELVSGPFRAAIPFRGGTVVDGGELDGETIARAFELRGGTFTIRAQPVDFGELAAAARPPEDAPLDPASRPPGRLSAVTVGDRRVQLQTEYVTAPSPMVVSVALREGRTLLKRSARAVGAREAVARLVEAQHAELEREVRQKLAELAAARASDAGAPGSPSAAGPSQALVPLFERGLNAFLSGDLAGALAAWEEASALDPDHATLQVNLAVVRRKLAAAS